MGSGGGWEEEGGGRVRVRVELSQYIPQTHINYVCNTGWKVNCSLAGSLILLIVVSYGRVNLTLTMHVSCAPNCGGGSSGPLARLNLPGNSWNTWLVTAIEVTFPTHFHTLWAS